MPIIVQKYTPDYHKYLCFCYKNKICEYIAYPNGLSPCHRKFTKLLKPVLCVLRTKGHLIIINFIDDLLLIATSYKKCYATILDYISVLLDLGFVLHVEKLVFLPQEQATF